MPPLQLGAGGDDFVEIAIGGRLAVAGESDVVQSAQRRRACREIFRSRKSRPTGDQLQHRVQFGQQRRHFDEPRFALLRAIDLAIDAIEIADLVGIEIHADRHSAAAAAEHRDRRTDWSRTSADAGHGEPPAPRATSMRRMLPRPTLTREPAKRKAADCARQSSLVCRAVRGSAQTFLKVVNSSIVTVVSAPSGRVNTIRSL